ncbi:UNVERIFIED_CONTAM: hypothetical protein FKN15_021215 [Acipenser sinensis]
MCRQPTASFHYAGPPCSQPRVTVSEDNAALGSLQESPQAPGQSTGVIGARAGVLCAYSANQNLSTQLKGVRKLVNSNFRDLKTFVNDTPAQIEYLANQYNTAKNKVIFDLDNIGPLLGSRIHAQLGKEVLPALDGALGLAGAMRETKEALENVSVSLEVLQEATDSLQVNLINEQARLSNTLNDPACSSPRVSTTCSDIRRTLSQLSINANFSTLPNVDTELANVKNVLKTDLPAKNVHQSSVELPNVDTELANVKNVLKTDLSNIVQKGYSTFNDTPDLVKNQTTNIVSGIKSMLDDIGSNITSFSKQIPVQDILANVTLYLRQSQSYVEDYYPVIDKYDFYRWMGCIVVCCMVALILTFNFLGLLCGTCGYDKHASPTTRGFISNTGGNLLMAGVGFSFLFSWVLMLIVMIAFVVGGNVEKLVCEPFGNRALFRPKGALENALKGHASSIRFIHGQQVVPLEQAMSTLNQSIRLLQRTTSDLPNKVNNVISAIDAAQNLITNNASLIITQETKIYMEVMIGYFKQYLDWVKNSSTLNQSIRLLQRTTSDLPETKIYMEVMIGYFKQYLDWVKNSFIQRNIKFCKLYITQSAISDIDRNQFKLIAKRKMTNYQRAYRRK